MIERPRPSVRGPGPAPKPSFRTSHVGGRALLLPRCSAAPRRGKRRDRGNLGPTDSDLRFGRGTATGRSSQQVQVAAPRERRESASGGGTRARNFRPRSERGERWRIERFSPAETEPSTDGPASVSFGSNRQTNGARTLLAPPFEPERGDGWRLVRCRKRRD
ncbi:hypothetical protein ACHAWF_015567 [Thalassiosira exigua]